VAHARALDAGVLEHDHEAVADGAGEQDPRRERGAQVPAAYEREQRRGEGEARDRQPAAVQPVQDELGERDGEPPQEPGGDDVLSAKSA
jgi:hypothetical protein